ncbi:MAG: hypothetical protein ACRDBQ_18310 [Shewanella sp.]
MKAVNIKIPPTLGALSSDELKELTFHAIQGRVGRDVIASILSGRFDTKRKINTVLSLLQQDELISYYLSLSEAGHRIDFSRTYFLYIEPHRGIVTIKQ